MSDLNDHYSSLDAEALAKITAPRDWAFSVLNKAIAQFDPYPEWVADTWERLERMDDAALDAVRKALDGLAPVADLDADAYELFYDFFPHVGPHPDMVQFFGRKRKQKGRNS